MVLHQSYHIEDSSPQATKEPAWKTPQAPSSPAGLVGKTSKIGKNPLFNFGNYAIIHIHLERAEEFRFRSRNFCILPFVFLNQPKKLKFWQNCASLFSGLLSRYSLIIIHLRKKKEGGLKWKDRFFASQGSGMSICGTS